MFDIFRMLQLVFWHTALYNEHPRKAKQRVKLKDVGLMPTPQNPVMGSALECAGTVVRVRRGTNAAYVRWDNGSENKYSRSRLLVIDFPLKFMPKFLTLNGNNPNVTFKELERYKEIEKERLEFEARLAAKKKPEHPRESGHEHTNTMVGFPPGYNDLSIRRRNL